MVSSVTFFFFLNNEGVSLFASDFGATIFGVVEGASEVALGLSTGGTDGLAGSEGEFVFS